MSRVRYAAAALAAMTTGVAALFLTLVPAQAASPDPTLAALPAAQVVNTTATEQGGTATFEVSPTTDLAATGATIKVVGADFSDTTDLGLTIAVCAAGSTKLTDCVGGPVPNDNTTTAWAFIGANGPSVTGGVRTDWKSGGFEVTLTLPSVVDGDVNCVTSKCSLYASSTPDGKVTIDPVPLTFKAPPPASSSVPSTPGTAVAQSVGTPSIVPGATQNVLFSGFKAGEQVNLTLFSAPVTLSPVTADGTGVANVSFVVPADSEVGTHRLEAIGQQSGTTGVATFQVIAPPVPTPSPTPSPSPSPSPTPSPTSSSVVASSSAPASSSAVTSSSAAAGTADDSGSSLWWLWLIIGIVVVAGIVTGVVVYRRNQQAQREQEEQDIADAAAQAQAAGATGDPYADAPTVFLPPVPPGPGGPPPGADPYGLLSGHDHPDSPTLYSGDPAGPTEVIGQGPGRPPYGQPLGQGGPEQGYGPPAGFNPPPAYGGPPTGPAGGPPTEAMPPVGREAGPQRPAGPPTGPDGPGTQAWAPDFDDTETGQPGSETPGDGDIGGPTGGPKK